MGGKEEKLKLWFRESAWIYSEADETIIKRLTKALKENGFPNCRIWQTEEHLKSGRYPQYLCSGDLGIGGDTIHFWRDGQTWWPMSGDYTNEQEDNAELILRETIIKFLEEAWKKGR